ncbi:hypothetical protein NQ317_003089 [Molorchus minor]|uniref:Uncharacterized protein n=1 Tax=Molorchus minor TaxID=1323400 RepID=A0ABQ9J9L4_9CUCU|nr:hypothetical protein NQ317_003089 [Molorchus minor]
MALRTACAYRTVSTEAIAVVAVVILIHLLVEERARLNSQKGDEEGEVRETRAREREKTLEAWQKWEEGSKGAWTRKLIPDVRK